VIILDTNIISAAMTPSLNAVVYDWLDRQPREVLWITTISILEIRFGMETLPPGRRRALYEHAFGDFIARDIGERILPFDRIAAENAATLAAMRRRNGRVVGPYDTQIAGIALARRAVLATRNIRDFADAGLKLVDPWRDG
jgi:predicted nucleic acid-binding protein